MKTLLVYIAVFSISYVVAGLVTPVMSEITPSQAWQNINSNISKAKAIGR